MNEITLVIIGIGIGYFWAMYRKDNIRVGVRIDKELIDAYLKSKEVRNLEAKLAAMREQIKKEGYHV